MATQVQAQNLQWEITLLEHPSDKPGVTEGNRILAAQRRMELAALMLQIAKAQNELAKIESKMRELRQEQTSLARQTDGSIEAWVHLCDVLVGSVPQHIRKRYCCSTSGSRVSLACGNSTWLAALRIYTWASTIRRSMT